MQKLLLNGTWTLEIPGSGFGMVSASVPGSVYHDLLNAQLIPDPFYRDNEMDALKLMDNDFHYSRIFHVTEDLLGCDTLLLRCEGLDTIAEIYINGTAAGSADNMHRIWEYDVRKLLRPGENTISIRFAPPT